MESIQDTRDTSDSTDSTLSRRALVTGGLSTGFALAVQPVSAQTITTGADGLVAGAVAIKAPDGIVVPAYRAMPDHGDRFPVVLVVQEIFGVHEHIKDVCRRFAKRGYLAIAPELYFRQGDVSQISDFRKIMSDVVSKVPDSQVMGDLNAAVAWAKASGKADTKRLAITGFCWGGRIVWLYAAHNNNLKAGVAWYGRLDSDSDPLHPKQPIDIAKDLKAPVLGLYGGKDDGIPQASVQKMRDALITAKKTNSEIVVYPDAGHGFHADYRPSYNEKDAKDGFEKLLAFFKKYGV